MLIAIKGTTSRSGHRDAWKEFIRAFASDGVRGGNRSVDVNGIAN